MIGLALSGGGSRAMAFHLGCLRALNDLDILDRIGVLSTISGGSVIGAYYAYSPGRSFSDFEADILTFLKKGFQFQIALELAKPANLFPCILTFVLSHVQDVASLACNYQLDIQRRPSRTDVFSKVLRKQMFSGLVMGSERRNSMEVVIGACELRTGSAFRFGNSKSGGWRQGELVSADLDVALAVAASAAYPVFLPAIDRKWNFRKGNQITEHRVLLTDGGVYDNLGLQVLEPGRSTEVSLHSFPCEYLIICNAGHGIDSGEVLPLGFFTRIPRSFEVVHRRVQDLAMRRLHHLRETGMIRGFAMPYLGQQDDRLPLKPTDLVSRDEVINCPTNFAAMDDEWINKLSMRGEQLTRALVSYYLYDLLDQS